MISSTTLRALVACLALFAQPLCGQNERLIVETVVDDPRPFAGQVVTARILLYVASDFEDENLVQPFRQQLDLPLQVRAEWADSPESPTDGARSIAWNSRRAQAAALGEVQRDGKTWRVYRVAQKLRATGEPITLEAPRVTAIYAEEFRDDFLEGRVPVERLQLEASGNEVRLTPRALPSPPPGTDFRGAIGTFEASWSLDRQTLRFGESLNATLRITGSGNLEALELPGLTGMEAFQILGRIEERNPDAIEIRYELAPRYATAQGPGFSLETFDPSSGAYRTVRAAPLSLAVRDAPPPPIDGAEVRAPVPGVDTIHRIDPAATAMPREGRTQGQRATLLLPALAILAAVLGIAWIERRRSRQSPDWQLVRKIERLHRSLDEAFEKDPAHAVTHLRALVRESFDPPFDHPTYRALEVRLDSLRFDPSGPQAPSVDELRIEFMNALIGLSERDYPTDGESGGDR